MKQAVNDLLLAFSYFTRLPVTSLVHFDEAGLGRAMAWFPLVGWVVAGMAVVVLWASALVLPLPIAVALSMLATILLTGAFHEDGLADSADGFGPVQDRQRALEVMKDSRIGTYGVLALGLVLGLKFLALSSHVSVHQALLALAVAHPLSRLAALPVTALQAYVSTSASRARLVAQNPPARIWLVALPAGLLPALVLLPWPVALICLAAAALVTLILAGACQRQFGGYTGDTLGAVQQGTEVVILLVILGTFQ